MGEAAGWYRDPAPPNPSSPSTLRFWDGLQWTAQVRPASKRQRVAWQADMAAERRAQAEQHAHQQMQQLQQSAVALAEAGRPAPVMVTEVSRDFTPDGEPLAGWGRRYAAHVIDGSLQWGLTIAFGWHYLSMIVQAYMATVNQVLDAQRAGAPPLPSDQLAQQLMSAIGPGISGFFIVATLVNFAYVVGFLKAFQATPGKMALGLQVRLRARPGPLPWGTVLMRWIFQCGYTLLGLLPLVGALTSVYWLLDNLWPLWDGKRQALHDKAAMTNVVRLR